MILIEKLIIKNFKSCEYTEINLNAFTALVGYNNAGKTNILSALNAFLEKKSISFDQLYDVNKPLEIIAVISGLNDEGLSLITDSGQRKSIEPDIIDGKLKIRMYQAVLKKPSAKLEIRPIDDSRDWHNPNGIDGAIKALLPEPIVIYSMQDANEDIGKYKATNTIGKLMKILGEQIVEQDLIDKISEINDLLVGTEKVNRLKGLDEFEDSITTKLSDFFPDLTLKFSLQPSTLSDMLAKVQIKVSEIGIDAERTFSEVGHGAQRSIQMTLVRQLADITKNNFKKSQVILIDEPELYLHPQAIEIARDALARLTKNGFQVIFTTHSPFMIQEEHILNTNIIRKIKGKTFVLPRICESITEIKSNSKNILFQVENLANILFSDKVLLIEGTTENIVLPPLFQKICSKSLNHLKISLVKADGAGTVATLIHLLNKMGVDYRAVVDLDFAFKNAPQNNHGFINANHPSIEPCKGILRKLKDDGKIYLGDDGYPRNGKTNTGEKGISAAAGFELLAESTAAKEHIELLHDDLKKKNIWLWKTGAIESCLCLEHKASNEWHSFKGKILNQFDFLKELQQPQEIYNFISWVTGNSYTFNIEKAEEEAEPIPKQTA